MPQILGYVTSEDRDRFEAYALAHGINVTALANLLIARELRARRLTKLQDAFDATRPLASRSKIVAHTPDAATKAAFTARAHEAGMKPSRAAAVLFRAELKERWLETYVLVNRFDST